MAGVSEMDKDRHMSRWCTCAMGHGRRTGRSSGSDLLQLANVGPAVVRYFERVGVTRTVQLAGRDPLEIYEEMCAADGRRHDLCLLDTVMSAVEQADGGPARPWWRYTAERRRLLLDRSAFTTAAAPARPGGRG